mmetsp:Transcript_25467/g.64527  ORF Transcript_25467/g.64527 Transcript_25467/m.64527 type:complete len:199 (+) Transcript_25467:62-658(+)|eukprot:CAMPEP_0118817006 /NCGR_PEP_ID=MMETSP1162-20130426/5131_1 /TAXON_ID=33656 /ORGANISM="Phaeocystis Sp, Strain CCMP2710" /LENGTH=198 /DNA_ID=CAMNT_0006747071 /DNA_START=60 /DNA_END=656 /DNA_ORIENTATION=-
MVLIGMSLLLHQPPLTPLPCIGRCASPVAMEPQCDMNAAFACALCFSPLVLGLLWGSEWNEARDRCLSARKRFEMERLRLMCGEGCLMDYQDAEEELMLAKQAAEDFRNFRSARRATRRVVSQLPLSGRAAPRRAPLAAMMAMRVQGWTLAKPKAKPAEAGAEAGAETEAEVEGEVEAAEEAEAEGAAVAPGPGGDPF